MQVTDEHARDLMAMSDERKWKLIKGDGRRRVALTPEHFVDQLRRHLDPELRSKKAQKKKLKDLDPSSRVLQMLEVALRTNPASWAEEFLDPPHEGHKLLMAFLLDLPKAAHVKAASDVLARQPGEHHLCLLCMRALMKHDYGFSKVVTEPGYLDTVAESVQDDNPRTSILAMQMLALAATDRAAGAAGAAATLRAVHHLSAVARERMRFQTIVGLLAQAECPAEMRLAIMTLVANVVAGARDLNMLVYLQVDLERAGLQGVLPRLLADADPAVAQLAREYQDRLVDVGALLQAREGNYKLYAESAAQLSATQGTLETVTKQRDELRTLHKEAQSASQTLQDTVAAYRKQVDALTLKVEEAAKAVLEQQELITEQRTQLREAEDGNGKLLASLAAAGAPLLDPATAAAVAEAKRKASGVPGALGGLGDGSGAVAGAGAAGVGAGAAAAGDGGAAGLYPELKPAPPAPPMPPVPVLDGLGLVPAPPAPPMPPPMPTLSRQGGLNAPPTAPPLIADGLAAVPPGMKQKRRITPNVAIPMVNWVPLRKITDTIFEQLDDERVLAEVDFRSFEAQFKLREGKQVDLALKTANAKKKDRVVVLDTNHARNLLITSRRVGLDFDTLNRTVLSTDLTHLRPEQAELLLNFLPKEEELAALERHSHHKERLAEAERFMYETSKIEKYEERLKVMAYIGFFDELILTVGPQIDAVIAASKVLLTSKRFRRILEVVLAFGNYMNSQKRGPAYGFKLESFDRLLDTKSTDRKQTLLHYIAHAVEQTYPEALEFLAEFEVMRAAANVSTVTLQTDVTGLSKGLELIMAESHRSPHNFVVFSFYSNAVHKVTRAVEQHRVMLEAYDHVCTAFNENSAKMEPFDFFAFFDKFARNFKKCQAENIERNRAPRAPVVVANVLSDMQRLEKFRDLHVEELPAHPRLGAKSKDSIRK